MARRRLIDNFVKFKVDSPPNDSSELPIVNNEDSIVSNLESSDTTNTSQINQFRTLANDRQTQYDAYDEMKTDSIIAAALEIYADDATAYDEQGRVIWVESDDENVARAGNRLLDILEIPERAWKHIYQACLYGDYYLKFYNENEDDDDPIANKNRSQGVKVVNDNKEGGEEVTPKLIEYIEDVEDPATIFDLRKRGKVAGFIEVTKSLRSSSSFIVNEPSFSFQLSDINVHKPDKFVHIMVGENLSRNTEKVIINYGEDKSAVYTSARGKSILQDVYPIQKELQLLEDSLLLNRLTRSSLIRLLEIELGDMPKSEVNNYLRRIKNLIEQHVALDKDTGTFKSFNAPGPIDNVIYIPVRNGKGSISVNNLGGDVNVRDIADIDYFNNKRSGALKIPRAYLGDDMEGSGLSNGGSLTKISMRYARTIKRIQVSYIRAITTVLNLFFIDKKLDYVNKFTVRMTSPSAQEDLERNDLILGNIDIISSIMDLTESLEGETQKKILNHLVSNVLKMPEIAQMIEEDKTPAEEIDIEGDPTSGSSGTSDFDIGGDFSDDFSDDFADTSSDTSSDSGGFTDDEFSEFEDDIT